MQDIRIAGDVKRIDTLKAWKSVNEDHIANRFRYSLHVCIIRKLWCSGNLRLIFLESNILMLPRYICPYCT